jgi:oxygen-independent coproporphyrinogen III oxidase
MVDALIKELEHRSAELQDPVSTIYFGGGTPSLLTPVELSSILNTIHSIYSIEKQPEITLEANPDDISSTQVIIDWMNSGVNRISLGVQSFKDEDLKWMNRAHDVNEVYSAFEFITQSGIKNTTLDLIYGLPNTNVKEWENQIDRFLSFNIPHLSAYCLTVENKTSLSKWVKENRILMPDDELQALHFETLVSKLEAAGYEQYEISNFAKEGFRSKHNTSYWEGKMYLGIGPSAHSFNGAQRRWNVSNNTAYIRGIEEQKDYWETEVLSAKDRFNELLMTGLRRSEGVQLCDLEDVMNFPDDFDKGIENFTNLGWLVRNNGVLSLSKQGKLRADHIASSLFAL